MTSVVFSHVGDLGNVYSDERGIISTKIVDHLVSLVGEYSVLGRSFVVSWSNLLTQLYGTSWFEYFSACSWCAFLGHERRSWQATDGCCGSSAALAQAVLIAKRRGHSFGGYFCYFCSTLVIFYLYSLYIR